jgi:DNA polymerase-1
VEGDMARSTEKTAEQKRLDKNAAVKGAADAGGAKPAIFLLDAMSFIFRAYHAMQRTRPMSTRTGVPTAATYVFINMINKLRADFDPEYLAAVFDVSAPVFRDERARTLTTVKKFNIKTQTFEDVDYAGYKANRAAMPEDLAQQLPYIRRALEAYRIPILFYEGYEADDVIGTLAKQGEDAGHLVYVVSNDKDMMQLVTERVLILNPVKDNLVLNPAKVEEVLGVAPERVIDVMALRGDSVDNIPGAPGIGDKGSVELIKQFGTVEGALEHATEVKRKSYRESLENNRDAVLLSKELVTIHCNIPMELDLAAMQVREQDVEASRALFAELEFTTLLKALTPGNSTEAGAGAAAGSASAVSVMAEPEVEYVTAPTAKQVKELAAAAAKSGMAIALEAEAPDSELAETAAEEEQGDAPAESMSLDFSATPEKQKEPERSRMLWAGVMAVDAGPVLRLDLLSEAAAAVRAALADAKVPKQVHDYKAAQRVMEERGLKIAGVRDDVMLYSYLINPTHGSHKLADVKARFSGRALGKAGDEAVMEAATAVRQLAAPLRKHVENSGALKTYEEIDLPLSPVLLKMEREGVRIDSEVLGEISRRVTGEMAVLSEQIYELSGNRFNINSPKQLGDVLFNKMGLPKPLKYGKGKVISTAQDVLDELSEHHVVPRLVLEYRGLAKLKSNYSDALPLLVDAEQRVHTTFNQVGTATGRLSSTSPNLQNIPVRTELGREIRAAFVAAPGNLLLSADYSQIELRLLAHFSEDPLLVEAYREGRDIHTLTAAEVFEIAPEAMDKQTRDRAKAINFGIVYGISAFGLAQQNIGIDQHEARMYIGRYFERYAGVRAYIDRTVEETRRTQQSRTMFGRVRPIPDILSSNANMRGFAERTAVNTPLQGTAADLIKLAMIRLDVEMTKRGLKSKMTLQVHDELVFEVPADEVDEMRVLVKEMMENVIELSVPLVADVGVGMNWRDMG